MAPRTHVRHWKRWLAIGVAGLGLALVAGPYIFFHFVEGKAPAPLGLASPSSTADGNATTGSVSASSNPDGTWAVTSDSVVGYRVTETLFGQSNEAVGRTSQVSGSITISGTTITAGGFTVDMATVTSDESRRDGQFDGRIMETTLYPTATFTLTQPIGLGSIPSEGEQRTFQATGQLTLHGVTKTLTFDLTGRWSGSVIQVAGSIPITFADWNISNPSFGPAQTEDHGTLEFLLDLTHA
jgi:polyisoprenoid-binding protein YceI